MIDATATRIFAGELPRIKCCADDCVFAFINLNRL